MSIKSVLVDYDTKIIATSMFAAPGYSGVVRDNVLGQMGPFNVILVSLRAHRGVAQSGSALHWGCKGHRFKSCRPDHKEEPQRPVITGGSFRCKIRLPAGACALAF